MTQHLKASQDPFIASLIDIREKYTAPFSECDEQTQRAITAHGIVGAEVLLVCARLPLRFVVVTTTEVCWLEQGHFCRVPLREITSALPPRYTIAPGPVPEEFNPKESEEYPTGTEWPDRELVLTTSKGEQFRLPVEPGEALGSFWNIIWRLSAMTPESRDK